MVYEGLCGEISYDRQTDDRLIDWQMDKTDCLTPLCACARRVTITGGATGWIGTSLVPRCSVIGSAWERG